MKREIITTDDGSVTIHLPEMNETYHSKFGAVQEAYHVFIKNGLDLTMGRPTGILEIGFGTGLNTFITFLETVKSGQQIEYTGVEAYPITDDEILLLNYPEIIGAKQYTDEFNLIHSSEWSTPLALSANFVLSKRKQFFQEINDKDTFDLIYFDAFGYQAQPDLWNEAIFKKMYSALRVNGILVTYACRTVIRKAMIEAGFSVEKIPGPPGKREMLRAYKY